MNNSFPQISVRQLTAFYYKNRRKLLWAFAVPFFLTLALSFVPSPRYKANGVLTVMLGSEFVYQPEAGSGQNGPQPSIPFDRDQIFRTEVAILNSDDLHAQVINQVGVAVLYPDLAKEMDAASDDGKTYVLAKAVEKFDKRLDVTLEKESSVITVSFEHKDAAATVKVLDTLFSLYMEKRKALYLEPREALAKTHSEEAHKQALAAGQAVEDYKREHNIHSLEQERLALLQQRADLAKSRLNLRSAALDGQISSLDGQLDKLDKVENGLNVLVHDETIAGDEYAVFAHRLSEAVAYEDLERERAGSVRVIQPPTAPAKPKSLQLFIIIGGFFFSLLCALMTAIGLDTLSSGFTTPEQLEQAIGLPVLTALSHRKYAVGAVSPTLKIKGNAWKTYSKTRL